MKNLSIELKKMSSFSGIEYGEKILELKREFPNNEQQIDEYIKNRVYAVCNAADEAIATGIRYQLREIKEVLSLTYIAENYFNKSRQWLNHRINGNIVNGKPAQFTTDQLITFNSALKDIGNKVGSISLV